VDEFANVQRRTRTNAHHIRIRPCELQQERRGGRTVGDNLQSASAGNRQATEGHVRVGITTVNAGDLPFDLRSRNEIVHTEVWISIVRNDVAIAAIASKAWLAHRHNARRQHRAIGWAEDSVLITKELHEWRGGHRDDHLFARAAKGDTLDFAGDTSRLNGPKLISIPIEVVAVGIQVGLTRGSSMSDQNEDAVVSTGFHNAVHRSGRKHRRRRYRRKSGAVKLVEHQVRRRVETDNKHWRPVQLSPLERTNRAGRLIAGRWTGNLGERLLIRVITPQVHREERSTNMADRQILSAAASPSHRRGVAGWQAAHRIRNLCQDSTAVRVDRNVRRGVVGHRKLAVRSIVERKVAHRASGLTAIDAVRINQSSAAVVVHLEIRSRGETHRRKRLR